MSDNKKCHENEHKHGHHHPEMIMGHAQYDPLMGPQFDLAKAYVKIQTYQTQFRPAVGLALGTIFPELYRPYPARCDD